MDPIVLVSFAALLSLVVWWAWPGSSTRDRVDQLLAAPPERADAILRQMSKLKVLEVLHRAVRDLSLDDRLAERPDLVERLIELDPVGAIPAALDLAAAGTAAPAERACRRILRDHPGHLAARRGLARLRREAGDLDGALAVLDAGSRDEPWFLMMRAEIAFDRGNFTEGTDRLRHILERARRHTMDGDAGWREVAEHADRLRQSLLRDLEGDEAVLRDAAASGRLAPNSGVNHTLVGLAAMARSPRVAERLELAPAEVAFERPAGERRLAAVREGEACLRLGETARARQVFRSLVEADPTFFPGQLGLGAALLLEEHGSIRQVRRLPDPGLEPAWLPVLPDLPALTDDEKRVVAASVWPLRRALPGMMAVGARIRLLPVDVRTIDVPEFAHLEGERHGTRDLASIDGLASTAGLAVARIESLLDICSPGSWVFGHEFGHLAFWSLPAADQASFQALYERERGTAWAFTSYQLQNVDEFFAVSYQDWLRERHGQIATHVDSSGAWRRVCGWFEAAASVSGP